MEKIKVIHFVDRIDRGGTQAVLFEWLKNIDRSKVQFDFLTFMDGREEYKDKFRSYGSNIYQISSLRIRSLPKFMKDLDSFFTEHDYDIAHGHSKSKNLLFLKSAEKHGIKVRIAHSHNTQFHRMALLGNIAKPMLRRIATDYYACSDIAGIWLFGKKAFDNGNVTIIKNGIDTKVFSYNKTVRDQYRSDFNIPDDKIVVGHVGRFMHQKNHPFLIEIFNEIHKKNPDTILMLVGTGDADIINYVNNKIEEYDIKDSVIQTGLRQDVANLMQAMDVFLLPSLHEGLPVVGVEAQAAGLPFLLSDTITREVELLPTTQYMSLNRTPEEWADRAIGLFGKDENNRIKASESIYRQGYDSHLVAEYLTQQYIKCLTRN